jgi:hypothetical protein
MATVSNINGQFKFVNTNKSEFYQYPKLSHLTYVLNNEGQYYIQFTYEDDYFVRIKLSELTNQPTWTNTQAGAEQAVADISSWIQQSNVSVSITDPIGQQSMSNSVSVTLASNQTGQPRNTGIIRVFGIGDLSTVVVTFYSVSVANVGTANGEILFGTTIKPGEVFNFSADAVNNYFGTFDYDATGTELVIIFVH